MNGTFAEYGMEFNLNTCDSLPIRRFSEDGLRDWYKTIFAIYDRMTEMCREGAYQIQIGGIDITVFPNVYAPGFFTDSLWFSHKISNIVKDGSLLEIGTGTGLISISCAINGAAVVATDINPEAVKNANINFDKNSLNISARLGDVYDPIGSSEKFDYIFWAHPFNNWNVPVSDMLLRSGMDHNYQSLNKYISGARSRLNPNGKLLLGTGDTADLETICLFSKKYGYRMSLIDEESVFLDDNGNDMIKYLIYEFLPIL